MKGKQLRKALALIGGFVGSAAMATGPAYATWSFATTASNTGTASVSVGGEIDTPSISASGGWLNQTVLFENNDDYIDGTLHYSGYTSGSAGVTVTHGPDNTYSIALGHVGAGTYSYSAYMTSPNAWPSQMATQTFSMPAPNNNMTCSITSPTGHYHVGETVSFTYTYTEATYPTVLAGIQSSVNANFIWTTDSTATSGGWNWSLNMFTHSGTTWTHTDINTISANATYYIRCRIKDGITGLYSAWKTIATVSPVEAAADITTSQQPHASLGISSNPSSWALSYRMSVSFSYTDCGRYYTYYYYSTTNSKPAMPTDGFAGTNNGVWHRTGSTNSSFVIENLTSSRQTYYWWVWAGCSLTKTSTYSNAKSGAVTLSAAVAAPSCINAQNSQYVFTRSAFFEWRNNSSYTVDMTGQQTGDHSWGPDTNTSVAAGSSTSFARSWAGMTGGTIYSYCKITFSGVTSGWYKTWKDYNTGNATPNSTSYYGTSNPT
jgi:hypothetical protein